MRGAGWPWWAVGGLLSLAAGGVGAASDAGGRSPGAGAPPVAICHDQPADARVARADRQAVQGTLLVAIGGTGRARMKGDRFIETVITGDERVVQPDPITAGGGRLVRLRGLRVGITRITLGDPSGASEVYRVIVVPAPVAAVLRALRVAWTSRLGRRPAPGARLNPAALDDFASTVMEATQILHDEHIKAVRRADLVRWAVEGLYAALGEVVPARLAGELARETTTKAADLRRLLEDARRRLGKRPPLDDLKDIDLALAGIFRRLEPGAIQRPQKELRSWINVLPLYVPAGIGVQLRKDRRTASVVVVTPVKDGPAYRAKVLAGDLILSFDYEQFHVDRMVRHTVRTRDRSLAEVEAALRGRPGSRVWLTVRREGHDGPLRIEVARGRADAETVVGVRRQADDRWGYLLDPACKIAYLRLTRFGRRTADELREALAELKRQGTRGMILDVRFNDGGPITNYLPVAEELIPEGKTIATIKNRATEVSCRSEDAGPCPSFPVTCLVNGETGGVAELLAACLRDHRRATLVGERTAGRVEIQNGVPLRGGEIRFTTGVYVGPRGENLSKFLASDRADMPWGVRPDPGLAVDLAGAERHRLRQHLEEQAIIPRRDRAPRPARGGFADRQLERALEQLRGILARARDKG
jgi:C-terminal peptidase prc